MHYRMSVLSMNRFGKYQNIGKAPCLFRKALGTSWVARKGMRRVQERFFVIVIRTAMLAVQQGQ